MECRLRTWQFLATLTLPSPTLPPSHSGFHYSCSKTDWPIILSGEIANVLPANLPQSPLPEDSVRSRGNARQVGQVPALPDELPRPTFKTGGDIDDPRAQVGLKVCCFSLNWRTSAGALSTRPIAERPEAALLELLARLIARRHVGRHRTAGPSDRTHSCQQVKTATAVTHHSTLCLPSESSRRTLFR